MFNLIHLRALLSSWLRRAKRALQNLVACLKQLREQLYRSFQQKQGEIDRQIHEILVNLRDWQRKALRKAIALLDDLLPGGSDRQIELALCEIANLITYRGSVGSLRPIRGAYKYLSEKQEALVWQFVGAYKRWFAMATKTAEEGVAEVKEVVQDLDATLEAEKQEEIPGAINWAIDKVGEAIQRWMPNLFPCSLAQTWDNWEAQVWQAVSKFKGRFAARSC